MTTAYGYGQGYTASVISGVANYVAADRSVLGQLDGRTANIAYSKVVWGASGQQLFVSNSAAAPSAFPVNISTPENLWLFNAINPMAGVVTLDPNGKTAINVYLAAGLSGLSFGDLNFDISQGITIVGFGTGGSGLTLGTNVGQLPGMSGGTYQRYMMVGNYQSGVGNILPITVTFGALAGGTVNLDNFEGTFVFEGGGVTVQGSYSDGTIGVTFGPTAQVPVILKSWNGNTLGIPVFGVSGATAIGITGTVSLAGGGVVLTGWSGGTGITAGIPIFGVSGATAVGVTGTVAIVGASGATFPVVLVTPGGTAIGGTTGSPLFVQIAGGTLSGLNIDSGITLLGFGPSGSTAGIPIFGVSGATAVGVTGTVAIVGALGATFPVVLVTPGGTAIGGTTGSPLFVEVVRGLSGITISGISFPNAFNISGWAGATTGITAGIPVFGVTGGLPIPVSTPSGSSITVTPATSSLFKVSLDDITTSGPLNIATPAGTSLACLVTINDKPGSNNVIVNNNAAQPIPIEPASGFVDTSGNSLKTHLESSGGLVVSLGGVSGITIGAFASGIGTLGVTLGPITGSVIATTNTTTGFAVVGAANSRTTLPVGVTLLGIASVSGINGVSAATGLLVTQKPGANFAIGLTLSNLFWTATYSGGSLIGFELNTSPVCVTKNYTGPARNGLLANGEVSVPLKQGLYVQLSKWDFVSHVYVGYTAANTYEFARNAQVLFREYQVAPVWSNALDQFRRYTGVTGNALAREFGQGESDNLAQDSSGNTLTDKEFTRTSYIGVVEKPTRIFIPCKDAGEIYVQPKGSYQDHTIGSGFFDYETGSWSSTSLYERNHFADNWWQLVNGFAGATNEPNLSASGSATTSAQYLGTGGIIDEGGVASPPPEIFAGGGGGGINPVQPVSGASVLSEVLASYTNNPFIRVWGY